MNSLIEYKPLTEVVTYSGDRYYKSCSKEEFVDIRAGNESVYCDVSRKYVASAHVKEWFDADPEDVAIAWETSSFTSAQRRLFDASKAAFLDFYGGTKALTNEMVRVYAELAKKGETAKFGR